jgi:hypothetical protein
MSEEVDLLPHLLLPLAGPEEFDAEVGIQILPAHPVSQLEVQNLTHGAALSYFLRLPVQGHGWDARRSAVSAA